MSGHRWQRYSWAERHRPGGPGCDACPATPSPSGAFPLPCGQASRSGSRPATNTVWGMCQSSGCRDSRPEDPGQLLGHHSDPLFTATASGHADLRVDLRTSIATFVGLAGSALILQVAPWRLLWWVMTAITLAPLPPVAASLPAEAARGASGAAAAARRIGATVRSPLPWIAGWPSPSTGPRCLQAPSCRLALSRRSRCAVRRYRRLCSASPWTWRRRPAPLPPSSGCCPGSRRSWGGVPPADLACGRCRATAKSPG
jgi:hypothetical protein